eukprot:gnl/TRDRNA2_/TRDRNA2_166064_c0_seq3.p1 gnl/TRDRNA2_/TRDRNA2_166064_c0~~gnl/TRDRNA2_/TRDRNA2_166064_c0_seq3.p1  ORF type:complete len:205 (-),score=29.94 gnl/TRDRNA2_/TRDRNA2_166064_c0_seq3:926-1540(-)
MEFLSEPLLFASAAGRWPVAWRGKALTILSLLLGLGCVVCWVQEVYGRQQILEEPIVTMVGRSLHWQMPTQRSLQPAKVRASQPASYLSRPATLLTRAGDWFLRRLSQPVASSHSSERRVSARALSDDPSLLPGLIVFDLDACLWTPEMYELRSPPTKYDDARGGVAAGSDTVRLFPGAAAVLRRILTDGNGAAFAATKALIFE